MSAFVIKRVLEDFPFFISMNLTPFTVGGLSFGNKRTVSHKGKWVKFLGWFIPSRDHAGGRIGGLRGRCDESGEVALEAIRPFTDLL